MAGKHYRHSPLNDFYTGLILSWINNVSSSNLKRLPMTIPSKGQCTAEPRLAYSCTPPCLPSCEIIKSQGRCHLFRNPVSWGVICLYFCLLWQGKGHGKLLGLAAGGKVHVVQDCRGTDGQVMHQLDVWFHGGWEVCIGSSFVVFKELSALQTRYQHHHSALPCYQKPPQQNCWGIFVSLSNPNGICCNLVPVKTFTFLFWVYWIWRNQSSEPSASNYIKCSWNKRLKCNMHKCNYQ